jgi:hypothetical protein
MRQALSRHTNYQCIQQQMKSLPLLYNNDKTYNNPASLLTEASAETITWVQNVIKDKDQTRGRIKMQKTQKHKHRNHETTTAINMGK